MKLAIASSWVGEQFEQGQIKEKELVILDENLASIDD